MNDTQTFPKVRRPRRTTPPRVSKTQMRRLARISGISYMSVTVHEIAYTIIIDILKELLSKAICITQGARKNTIQYGAIQEACVVLDCSIQELPEEFTTKTKLFQPRHKGDVGTKEMQDEYDEHPGFLFSVSSFRKQVRWVVQNQGEEQLRMEKRAQFLIQYIVETRMIHLFQMAMLAMEHSNRITLQREDFDLVRNLMKSTI